MMTSRRAVLVCGCAAALAGCQVYGRQPQSAPQGPVEPGAGGQKALAKVADIPVGGGKIFGDQGVVVTQPSQGVVKAFSATCTHQGCRVANVSDGTINCTCHGSKFRIDDGSVVDGPAPSALPAAAVTVADGEIRLG